MIFHRGRVEEFSECARPWHERMPPPMQAQNQVQLSETVMHLALGSRDQEVVAGLIRKNISDLNITKEFIVHSNSFRRLDPYYLTCPGAG